MINLLPVQRKKSLKTEYVLRLVITILVFFGILGYAGIAMLIPSYVYSKFRLKTIKVESEQIRKKNEGSQNSEISAILSQTSKKLELVKPNERQYLSHLLIRVIGLRGSGISFSTISVSGAGNERTLILSGLAKTRTELIEFYKRFDNDKSFSKVNLPISSYSKDKDIEFNVTFTTKI